MPAKKFELHQQPPTTMHTFKECAAALAVSKDTIERWVASGRLPVVRFPGRVRRVTGADLQALIDESREAR